jgi:hypothetical protein
MMGRLKHDQEQLFYEFRHDEIDRHIVSLIAAGRTNGAPFTISLKRRTQIFFSYQQKRRPITPSFVMPVGRVRAHKQKSHDADIEAP